MIEIRLEDGEYRPYPVCDYCGEVIECHGNVEWNPEEPTKLYFTTSIVAGPSINRLSSVECISAGWS